MSKFYEFLFIKRILDNEKTHSLSKLKHIGLMYYFFFQIFKDKDVFCQNSLICYHYCIVLQSVGVKEKISKQSNTLN